MSSTPRAVTQTEGDVSRAHETPPTSYAALLRKAMEALTALAPVSDLPSHYTDDTPAVIQLTRHGLLLPGPIWGDFRRARAVRDAIAKALS